MATIPTYADPVSESVLAFSVDGPLVIISQRAHVEFELVNDFDKQRHKNQNFGRKKFLGISFAKVEVTFVVMPDEEKHFWDKIVPLLRQRGKTANAPAMEVVNYQLNRAGISTINVVSSKIGPPNARSGRSVQLRLEEWSLGPSKPKPSAGKTEQLDATPGGLVDQALSLGRNT